MNKGKTFGFVRVIGLLGLLVIASCSSSDSNPDPFVAEGFNPYDQELGTRVAAYNNIMASPNQKSKNGNPALYIDFSSGINNAFAEPAIKSMMTDCFNTILAQNFEVYKLGSNKVTALNVTNTTDLGQQVSNPGQYLDIWAPIQSAVEKIVDGDNDALLITDFEEWQNNIEITNAAYLKIPFSKWLERGNSIHFFIADYKEGTVDKHLYFTIFSYGITNASSMISKLEDKLGPLTTRFDLSNQSYKLRTAYPSDKTGGVFYDSTGKSDKAKNVFDLKDSYINGLKNGQHFEFYPFGLDWENIEKLHATYPSQTNDFFRKLYIDLSNQDSYTFEDFDVKVSDVTMDFELFAKAEEVKKHKPKLTTGNNGESRFADEEHDIIALTCYNPDGKLKEEWVFKPQPAIPLNEFFTLNKTLFSNTKGSDNKNVEFGVSFDPKFSLKNIQNPDGIVKVDVVLNTATPNLTDAKLLKFQWVNAKKAPNIALAESIKNTLQELKPTNKIVHSYYIKTKQ